MDNATPQPTNRSAVAYIRASTEDQVNSLEVQKRKLEDYCRYKGIHLVDTFIDAGVSGSECFDQRPEGKAMLEFIELSGVKEIIFTTIDRAFRKTADCLETFARFRENGIQCHALDLDIDTSTATGRLIVGMRALIAEYELDRRQERQMETLEVLRADSRKIGEVPYGYRAVADTNLPESRRGNTSERLEVDPVEQVHLESIFDLAANEGWGAKRIASWLTQRGVPTKKGGEKWSPSTIDGLLAKGKLADGRTYADFQVVPLEDS